MRIRILANERAVAEAVARRVVRRLCERPATVLGLPTGRTPIELYGRLRRAVREGQVSFGRATTFNLDEFLGLRADHPASYRTFMETHLFHDIDLPRRRIHFFDGMTANPERECARYEAAIRRAGGIDLQILGIGANGHIGFNEPAAGLSAHSHKAHLEPGTRRSNAALFGGRVSAVPREALSMGVGTILHSRTIILMATGAAKSRAVAATIEGAVTTRVPASLLQLHTDVEVVLDRAAAARLRRRR